MSPCRGQRSIKSKQRKEDDNDTEIKRRKRDFKLFEENLCKRWKRREEFSQQIEGLETAEKGMNMLLQNKLREKKKRKSTGVQCMKSMMNY